MSSLAPSIRGSTELMFVVADPVAQVKAPEAANRLLARAGVDAVVVPARVSDSHLRGFVREALALPNARGLFVSIPHKTRLVNIVDRLDGEACAAGAVNAVRRGADGAIEGALFDGAGFLGALRHLDVALAGARALLVGAGGAGLAIAAALAQVPLAELQVHDRDARRAATLAARAGARAGFPVSVAAHGSDPAGFQLVIQATPLGLQPGDPLPLDAQRLDASASLMDILMTPAPTPLVRAARQRGVRAHMGHEMLVQQLPEYLGYFGFTELARVLRAEHADWLDEVRELIQVSPASH
jgi:shikimate dehydrogenase